MRPKATEVYQVISNYVNGHGDTGYQFIRDVAKAWKSDHRYLQSEVVFLLLRLLYDMSVLAENEPYTDARNEGAYKRLRRFKLWYDDDYNI